MMFALIFLVLCANIYLAESFRRIPFSNAVSKANNRSMKLNEAQKFTSFEDMLTKLDKPVLVDFFAQWSVMIIIIHYAIY